MDTAKKPVVYVVMKNSKYDLEPAKQFGELRLVIDEHAGRKSFLKVARKALRDFTDDDYLVLTGDYVAIGIAVKVASDMTCGHVKILKWSADRYYPLEVNFNERDHEGE